MHKLRKVFCLHKSSGEGKKRKGEKEGGRGDRERDELMWKLHFFGREYILSSLRVEGILQS